MSDFEKQTSQTTESAERKELQNKYAKLVKKYQQKFKEIKQLEHKHRAVLTDPDVQNEIQLVDAERHDIHLELSEVGERLGKNMTDVMVDLIRQQGNLEEFGLPEFAILTEDEVEWLQNGATSLAIVRGNAEFENTPELFPRRESGILGGPQNILLVYDVCTHQFGDGYSHRSQLLNPDSEIRADRMMQLAEATSAEPYHFFDGFSHGVNTSVSGLIIPKDQLEIIASLIRVHPERYRLQSEFYTPPDVDKARQAYILSLEKVVSDLEELGHSFSHETDAAQGFLNYIKHYHGDEARALADEVVKDVVRKRQEWEQERHPEEALETQRLEQEKQYAQQQERAKEEELEENKRNAHMDEFERFPFQETTRKLKKRKE